MGFCDLTLLLGIVFIAVARRVTVDSDDLIQLVEEETNTTKELCCATAPESGVISTTKILSRSCRGHEQFNYAHGYEVPLKCCDDPLDLVDDKFCRSAFFGNDALQKKLRKKTIYIVNSGESRKDLRDPPLILQGEDQLNRLFLTVEELDRKARQDGRASPFDALLASPLMRSIETAVIGFQELLFRKANVLEMLPLIREMKKPFREFRNKGNIYEGVAHDEKCLNRPGLWKEVQHNLRNLAESKKRTNGSNDTSMLENLKVKSRVMPDLAQEMIEEKHFPSESIDKRIWAKAEKWYDACNKWWDGEFLDLQENLGMHTFMQSRPQALGVLLGLRNQEVLALTGHSQFWLDFFKRYVDLARFSHFKNFRKPNEIVPKYLFVARLQQQKIAHAAIVKVTLECSVIAHGPCMYISDVEPLHYDLDENFPFYGETPTFQKHPTVLATFVTKLRILDSVLFQLGTQQIRLKENRKSHKTRSEALIEETKAAMTETLEWLCKLAPIKTGQASASIDQRTRRFASILTQISQSVVSEDADALRRILNAPMKSSVATLHGVQQDFCKNSGISSSFNAIAHVAGDDVANVAHVF